MKHIIAHLLEVIGASNELKKDYLNNPENMIADMTYGYNMRNKLSNISNMSNVPNIPMNSITDMNLYNSPVDKGRIGELYVYNAIKDNFPTRIISEEPYSTDIIIDHNYGKILIEVKNYSNPCPLEQYNKFIRDIDVNIYNCIGAIYITLGNGMILPNEDCHLMLPQKYKGIPIICINSIDKELFINAVNIIIMLHKSDVKISKINRQLESIKNLSLMIGKQRYELKKYKNNTNLLIDRVTNNLFEIEYDMKKIIENIVNNHAIEEHHVDNFESHLFGIAIEYNLFIREVYYMIYSDLQPYNIKKLKTKKIITWENLTLEMSKTILYVCIRLYHVSYIPLECEYKNNWLKFKITKKDKSIIPEMKKIIMEQYNNIDWLFE